MSALTYIDAAQHFFSDRVHQEAARRRATPLVTFSENAIDAAAGIETVTGILLSHAVDTESDSNHRTLSPQDVMSLLGLIKFAAKSLRLEACGLSDWAEKHFVPEADQ
ncbi:hypothetical protein [Bordetella genomosp. 4]|uniref:hypothetical protein n=1 Tax=Bordetella genomosp. 4 TaxID=463044 RepID=UPI000B9EA12B|nr:hypothetical protein [Bordetella genomosp. 4]OZI43186.1 hypothetical protein CAL21_20560 [Bordetella genomosp. 4]